MFLHVTVSILVGINQHKAISVELDARSDVEILSAVIVLST